MEPTIIMSAEFVVAVYKEISVVREVIENYHPQENNFELDDYKRYLNELEQILDWTITE